MLATFEKFEANSKGWFKAHQNSSKASVARQRGAIASMQLRSTPQERKVCEELRKKGFAPKLNKALSNKVIVDVYLEKPAIIVIECKQLVTFNRRQQTKKIRELAYQGYKTKFLKPSAKVIALIAANLPLTQSDLEELQGPFDIVCRKVSEVTNYCDQLGSEVSMA